MTPKEKALELVIKFKHIEYPDCGDTVIHKSPFKAAKVHAAIAVDEILNEHEYHNAVNWNNQREERKQYWQSVREEIQKL